MPTEAEMFCAKTCGFCGARRNLKESECDRGQCGKLWMSMIEKCDIQPSEPKEKVEENCLCGTRPLNYGNVAGVNCKDKETGVDIEGFIADDAQCEIQGGVAGGSYTCGQLNDFFPADQCE